MSDLNLPTAAEFALFSESFRPVAVVRALCNQGHPISEYWQTADGGGSAWRGSDIAVRQVAVNSFKGFGGTSPETATWKRHVENPDRPDDSYFRTNFACVRPSCNYRLTLDQESTNIIDVILTNLREHGVILARALVSQVDGAQLLDHPSASVGVAAELNRLLRVHNGV